MKRNSKALGTLMAVMSAMSMILAACGGTDDKPSTTISPGNAADEAPYEIQMNIQRLGTDMGRISEIQKQINEITLKEINATVNITPIEVSAWVQQTNLLLAGSEKLDLLVTGSALQFSSQVAKNQLLPLDELLAEHGQGIVAAVGEDMLGAAKIDGEIYGVPSMRDFAATYGVALRKDLVDKYQIDLSGVKTWEDLGPVFKTLVENEKDMALSRQTQSAPIVSRMIGDKFDILGDNIGVLSLTDNDLKVINMFEHPDYISRLQLVREWYQAGYIIKDLATNQQTGQNLTKAGKSFGYTANMKPAYDVQASAQTGFPMTYVELTEPISSTSSVQSFMMSIAKNSENPVKAMQFLNLLYSSEEIMNLLTIGIEGEDYIVNEDGSYTVNPEMANPYTFNQWQVGNNYLTHIQQGNPLDYWDQIKQFNASAVLSPAFGFTFNAEPVKTEIAAATNVLNQFRMGLETGILDPEKNLPEFNQKLKAAGLDKIIAEKQNQLDEWAASRK